MPIRGSPNGAYHPHPQAGRDRPEWVVAIKRNAWSQSIGIAGRDHPVRARLPKTIAQPRPAQRLRCRLARGGNEPWVSLHIFALNPWLRRADSRKIK